MLNEKNRALLIFNFLALCVITLFENTVIVLAFQHCRQPLFLRLAFDEARRWQSYTIVNEEALATTVRASIWKLFARLEVEFGTKVVSHALGYITAARYVEVFLHGMGDFRMLGGSRLNFSCLFSSEHISAIPFILMEPGAILIFD